MTRLSAAVALAAILAACASNQSAWRIEDAANAQSSEITLTRKADKSIALTMDTRHAKRLIATKVALAKLTGINPELHIIDSKEANAFAGYSDGKAVIGFYIGMIELLGDDKDASAAILGHEFAHLALGHAAAGQARERARAAGASIAGVLLGLAGVPAGGSIADLASQAVATVYSRDEEREADRYGVQYMRQTGHDPRGAVRAWEKMATVAGFNIPFLSSHPQSAERLETMKRLAAQ